LSLRKYHIRERKRKSVDPPCRKVKGREGKDAVIKREKKNGKKQAERSALFQRRAKCVDHEIV